MGVLKSTTQLVFSIFLLQCWYTDAFWTVDCSILTREKTDPIVSPGRPSSHQHVVAGASKFTQIASNSIIRRSRCSTCNVKHDFSNYWTPQLYIAPPESVAQRSLKNAVPVPNIPGVSFVVYYKLITKTGERSNNDPTAWEIIKPFPTNFRVVASEAMILNKTLTAQQNVDDRPITYKCLGDGRQESSANFPADPSLCVNGLRTQITFPSCHDGKNSDSFDHSSHMAYPIGSWAGSECPPTHPVRLPTLFYEIIYDTKQVKDQLDRGWKLMFPRMANQFTSAGEPLFHADFLNGWDMKFLKNAVSVCGVTPCGIIEKQQQQSTCTKELDVSNPSIPAVVPVPPVTPNNTPSPNNIPSPSVPMPLPPSPPKANQCTEANWKMLFEDNFDFFDQTKWSYQLYDGAQYGIPGWGNNQLEWLGTSKNVYTENGNLVIKAQVEQDPNVLVNECIDDCSSRCQSIPGNVPGTAAFNQTCLIPCSIPRCDLVRQRGISSGRIRSYQKFAIAPSDQAKKVRIETKVKLPVGPGLWPAVWMLPEAGAADTCSGCGMYGNWPTSGEIDVMETVNDMGTSIGTLHYGGPGSNYQFRSYYAHTPNATEWQTFAIEWEASEIRFYANGIQYGVMQSKTFNAASGWFTTASDAPNAPFNVPFHLLMNLAVGGTLPSIKYAEKNAGAQLTADMVKSALAGSGAAGQQMLVDYVRVCAQ